MSKPFWKFITNKATADEPESVELRITGELIDDDWVWLYEWIGIPGTAPNKFRNELSKYAGKNITVWIDSCGGSVFAGAGIFNALMEHKKTGAKIDANGEKVMSAAGLPYMAGDKKIITLGGMFMMHNPLPGNGIYGYADELRKYADILDEFKEAIVNIYEHGTGLDRKTISDMMDNETYMSAHTAVEKGFADSVLYAKEQEGDIKNSNTKWGLIFNRLAIQNCAKNSMDKLLELAKQEQEDGQLKMTFTDRTQHQAKAQPTPVENKSSSKEDKPMEIKNIDDLRKAYPDLVAQVEAAARDEGAQAERERIKGIEDIAKNIDPALVNKAKFEEPKDAKDLAFDALKADKMKAQDYLDDADNDSKESGVGDVGAVPVDGQGGEEKPKNINEKFKSVAAKLDAKRRGIKVE